MIIILKVKQTNYSTLINDFTLLHTSNDDFILLMLSLLHFILIRYILSKLIVIYCNFL